MPKFLDIIIGGFSGGSKASPEKTPSGIAQQIQDEFKPHITVKYIASTEHGAGSFVIDTTTGFSRTQLTKIGFKLEQAKALEMVARRKWDVPPEVMEKTVPGAASMAARDLTAALQKVPGHEKSIVEATASGLIPYITVDMDHHLKVDAFKGTDDDHSRIEQYPIAQKRIFIPEGQLRAALKHREQHQAQATR